MAAVSTTKPLTSALESLGDWTTFALTALWRTITGRVYPGTYLPVAYDIGVRSVFVVGLTGAFIGMVLAVQAYGQFRPMGLETWMGSMINASVIRELGPVLAATMLAGRVGSAMAAEIGTMRVTEQIEALACLGVEPVRYLVVPRLIASVLLIPLLTILADVLGILGGAAICLGVFGIEPHHYWEHGRANLELWDLFVSLGKSSVFGGFIALIACYRGFRATAGSEGVGQAATSAFVLSFITILVLDFFMAMALNSLHEWLFGLQLVRVA